MCSELCLCVCGDGLEARETDELLVRLDPQIVVCWPCAVVGPEDFEPDSVLHTDIEIRVLAESHAVSKAQNVGCIGVRRWVDGEVSGSCSGAVWVFVS